MHFDWAIAFCLLLVVAVLAAASVRELARWIWPYLRVEEERESLPARLSLLSRGRLAVRTLRQSGAGRVVPHQTLNGRTLHDSGAFWPLPRLP